MTITNLQGWTFIDLFAGIGGFHTALSSFGAECLFASEWDKHAAKTYSDNYNLQPAGDITEIHEADIPAHDILCGGFPCQAFSISGKQRGFEDTRGTLFFDIARIAKKQAPKIIFLENVKNIVRHDNGNTMKTIVDTLNSLGYNVFTQILNASHYGLPQNRERIFFVCFRKDLSITDFTFPKVASEPTSLLDILEENPKDGKVINRPDIFFTNMYEPDKNLFGEITLPNRPIQIGKVNKGGQGERIYHPLGHAITLSAYGGGVGAKTGLYLVDGVVRKLSPRECARLQGFPDSFMINSSLTQSYKQFGNSVAVTVVKHIIQSILEAVA